MSPPVKLCPPSPAPKATAQKQPKAEKKKTTRRMTFQKYGKRRAPQNLQGGGRTFRERKEGGMRIGEPIVIMEEKRGKKGSPILIISRLHYSEPTREGTREREGKLRRGIRPATGIRQGRLPWGRGGGERERHRDAQPASIFCVLSSAVCFPSLPLICCHRFSHVTSPVDAPRHVTPLVDHPAA